MSFAFDEDVALRIYCENGIRATSGLNQPVQHVYERSNDDGWRGETR